MKENEFSKITPELQRLADLSERHFTIDPSLYSKYDVKRGLRDINGKGVLVGLTEISEVCATKRDGDQIIPADGIRLPAVFGKPARLGQENLSIRSVQNQRLSRPQADFQQLRAIEPGPRQHGFQPPRQNSHNILHPAAPPSGAPAA